MFSFPSLEAVCCFMSSSNCCFLTCIQVSQEAGQVVWYSHLFQNFPQFIVIHTVKGFGIVNKAEIDVFLELSCFFMFLNEVKQLSIYTPLAICISSFLFKIFAHTAIEFVTSLICKSSFYLLIWILFLFNILAVVCGVFFFSMFLFIF